METPIPSEGRACAACATPQRADDRFCKRCGAPVGAPSQCTSCKAALPSDARFCPGCGARVEAGAAPASTAAAPAPPTAPSAPPMSARELVEGMKKSGPSKGSSIASNVLLFVALLLVFLVFTREWNQGKPKEANMFGGGGAPSSSLPAANLAKPPDEPASAGSTVQGTIALAPGLDPSGTLFVLVRPAGAPDKGPPTAVRRLDASFPQAFAIGAADVMMGAPFVGPFDLYVRLDRDGNAMTRDPSDVTLGPIAGVMPGGAALSLTLGGPAPSAAASPPASPAASPPAAASGPIQGQVVLDPSVGAVQGVVVYVIARAAGTPDRGPPLAVRKYERPSFPLAFTLGPEDMMMEGTSFTGPFDLWARLDGDGDAASRTPGDVEMSKPAPNVAAGAKNVELKLDRRR